MDQYDEAEEGGLEGEDIEGYMDEDGERMKQLLEDNEKEKATRRQQLDRAMEITKAAIRKYDLDDDDNDLEIIELKDEEKGEKWDCESILSTYSTLYNHPKLISEPKSNKIQLSSKTGIPKGVLGRGLTSDALRQLDMETAGGEVEDDLRSKISTLS